MSLEKIINGIKKAACVGAAALALAVGGVKEANAQEKDYEIIRLEMLNIGGITEVDVVKINNQGEVAGTYKFIKYRESPPGIQKPFVYNLNGSGAFVELKDLPRDFFAEAKAINNSRKMILYKEETKEYFIYDFFDNLHTSIYPVIVNGVNIVVRDINDKGEFVGENYIFRPRGDFRPLGEMIELDPNGLCDAYAINENNQVVGDLAPSWYYPMIFTSSCSPFIWENGVITQLPVPTNVPYVFRACARDINNNKQIVGFAISGKGGKKYACLWENRQVTTLAPYPYESEACSINDLGQIVGNTLIDGVQKAVLWQNKELLELSKFIPPDSGWLYLYEAIDINNKGWIIGRGYYKVHYSYLDSPFLLKPKTKPSADINKDGIVNLRDLSELGEHWLEER